MSLDPHLFQPHANLSDELNRNIVQSEIEGGVFLHDLPPQSVLRIQTQHRQYTLVHCGGGEALISGHPEFCPRPVLVRIQGSTWGGSVLKIHFLGRGMHLEFRHPAYQLPIVTSCILDVEQCDGPAESTSQDSFPAELSARANLRKFDS